jgi:molybdopterin synthase sulfur carrier subunit
MTVRVKFFAHFREVFGAKDKAMPLAPGATVKDILEALCDTAERRRLVFDGGLKPHVVVMKNGSSILSLQGLATPLETDDTLAIFPMLGGG